MTTADLRAALSGAVIVAGDDGWDAARLFHSGIGEPDLIVVPASVRDVRAVVQYAARTGSPIGVRGGGHSAWGTLPGGVVIDLRALNGVYVDGDVVSVGGGAVWGDVARELVPRGLGLNSGDTASVGVGGLTLGGGIGWMVRAWGLAVDQLVGAQVVTAAGRIVETSADQHPDLFWALRGGGGNFGVVTRFDFRARALPGVVFASYDVGPDRAATVRVLREMMRTAPRALTVTYMDVPAMDPSAPAGATVTACWIGEDVAAARAVLAPLVRDAGAVETECAVRSYPDILLDAPGYDPEQPMPGFVGGNTLLVDLDDEAIDALVAFRADHAAGVLLLRSLGGAYSDVPQEDTPFPGRAATWFAMAGAFRIPGLLDAGAESAAQTRWDAIEALGAGSYGNFTTTVEREWARRLYPSETWERLAAVKSEWDPQNLFSYNHNVPPA